MFSQGANSHCVFALDFPLFLVYVICIRHERLPVPHQTLRHRAQLPFPDCAALLWSMVPSRHSLGTFRHVRQVELPVRSRGTAYVLVPSAEPGWKASPDLCPKGLAATR